MVFSLLINPPPEREGGRETGRERGREGGRTFWRESVLFIGTQFSNLYTAVDSWDPSLPPTLPLLRKEQFKHGMKKTRTRLYREKRSLADESRTSTAKAANMPPAAVVRVKSVTVK